MFKLSRYFSITSFVGIAVFPRDIHSVEQLIKAADTAMYRAKELGRDRYEFYTEERHAREDPSPWQFVLRNTSYSRSRSREL